MDRAIDEPVLPGFEVTVYQSVVAVMRLSRSGRDASARICVRSAGFGLEHVLQESTSVLIPVAARIESGVVTLEKELASCAAGRQAVSVPARRGACA